MNGYPNILIGKSRQVILKPILDQANFPGILITANDCKVKDLSLLDFSEGVNFQRAHNCTIEGVSISPREKAITIKESGDITINHVELSGHNENDPLLNAFNSFSISVIDNCKIHGNEGGIWFENVTNSWINDSVITASRVGITGKRGTNCSMFNTTCNTDRCGGYMYSISNDVTSDTWVFPGCSLNCHTSRIHQINA